MSNLNGLYKLSGVPQYYKFYEEKTSEIESNGAQTWTVRAANFIVSYTDAVPGTVLVRENHPDEYILLLLDCGARIDSGGKEFPIPGRSVTIIPPGSSAIRLEGTGQVVRIFTTRAKDLLYRCSNRESYSTSSGSPISGPEPKNGFCLRTYLIDQYPPSPPRIGRIFRSRELMINVLYHRTERRDITMMTPHSHEDFEQGSLALSGTFVHHIRSPWGKDMTTWRPDEHEVCGSPSLCIIPPAAIHTSQDVGTGTTQLIDIFGPPRKDFIEKGWVLNGADYSTEEL